jgi:hypothetical protein
MGGFKARKAVLNSHFYSFHAQSVIRARFFIDKLPDSCARVDIFKIRNLANNETSFGI